MLDGHERPDGEHRVHVDARPPRLLHGLADGRAEVGRGAARGQHGLLGVDGHVRGGGEALVERLQRVGGDRLAGVLAEREERKSEATAVARP